MNAKRVLVARIGAAHGTRGEVRLFAFTDDPLAIDSYGALEDETGTRQFRIVALRPAKGHLLARFEEIDDRTAAERLTNLELYVPRVRLPELESGTFYHADLVGLSVQTTAGENLGTVIAVQNFGAGDLIEIVSADGGESFMIPFVDQFVPEVDVEGGRMIVAPPEGLLDRNTGKGRRAT